MSDYSIQHTPERKTIRASGDGNREEGEPIGMQIEGHTTFSFIPESSEYTEEEYVEAVEAVIEDDDYEYGSDADRPYYRVVYQKYDWSYYHVAVQADKRIDLFVQTATTERSVEEFHDALEEVTGEEWNVEKYETDMNGAGPNRVEQ